MEPRPVRLSPTTAAGLWLLAALIGSVAQLMLTPAVFGWQGRDLFPDAESANRTYYLVVWLLGGALALLGFAWTLLKGPVGRIIPMDGVVIFFGMSSPLGLVAAVASLVMVTSWGRWRPIAIGFVLAAAGAMLDVRLQVKTSPGPEVLIGALVLLVAAAVIGVWRGRRAR